MPSTRLNGRECGLYIIVQPILGIYDFDNIHELLGRE
jgi:hypothetical protein